VLGATRVGLAVIYQKGPGRDAHQTPARLPSEFRRRDVGQTEPTRKSELYRQHPTAQSTAAARHGSISVATITVEVVSTPLILAFRAYRTSTNDGRVRNVSTGYHAIQTKRKGRAPFLPLSQANSRPETDIETRLAKPHSLRRIIE
jgi:hypothetical protein